MLPQFGNRRKKNLKQITEIKASIQNKSVLFLLMSVFTVVVSFYLTLLDQLVILTERRKYNFGSFLEESNPRLMRIKKNGTHKKR